MTTTSRCLASVALAIATWVTLPAAPPVEVSAFDRAWSAGFAEEQRNALERADVAFDEAVALAADDTQLYRSLTYRARVRSRLGRHTEARNDLDAALRLPLPQDDAAHRRERIILRLHVTRAQGDLIAASAAFRDLDALPKTERSAKIVVFQEKARLLRAWGDLSGALDMFDQLEPLLAEANNLAELAEFDRERATARLGLDDRATALKLVRNALSIDLRRVGTSRRRPEKDWVRLGDLGVAQSLLIYAETDRQNYDFTAAGESFELALALAQRISAPREIVRSHFGLARLQLAQLDFTLARLHVVAALLITQDGAMPDLHVETLALAGECSLMEGDPAAAIEPLSHGITLVEELRLTAPAEDRARLLAVQADHYRWLLEAYLRTGQTWEALATSEALKARTLRDSIAKNAFATDLNFHNEGSEFLAGMFQGLSKVFHEDSGEVETLDVRVTQLRELQSRIPADLVVISYANADWNRSDPVAFVLTPHDLQVVRLPFHQLPEFFKHLDVPAVLAAQASDVDATRYHLGTEVTLAGLVAYYRQQIYCKATEIPERVPALILTAKILRYLLIHPLTEAIGDHERLLISPSGLLAYVPFDTLREPNGATILNRYAISLTPSLLTTLALAKRPEATYERSFLGFGGAVYDPRSYSQDIAGSSSMKAQLEVATAVRGAQVAGSRSPFAGWSRGPASNLAGTKAEVELLSELIPESTVVIGRDVSEPFIRKMADAGDLRRNRVLHFAVHGSAVAIMPELSCILLSWEGELTPELPAERDGRLQIGEFEELSLRAELVTFSACETGLGAIIAGEGVIGLTGSLLTAGADAVLASLWPVSDFSTVYFMRRFYEMHLIEGVPSDLAIARAKRDMEIGKLAGFQHPQYWAPFNLYGGRELVRTD